jgi:hypothetical protein
MTFTVILLLQGFKLCISHNVFLTLQHKKPLVLEVAQQKRTIQNSMDRSQAILSSTILKLQSVRHHFLHFTVRDSLITVLKSQQSKKNYEYCSLKTFRNDLDEVFPNVLSKSPNNTTNAIPSQVEITQ